MTRNRGGFTTSREACRCSGEHSSDGCGAITCACEKRLFLFAPCRRLVGLCVQESVQAMVNDGVDVLIDLNGHTLRTGLPMFAYRPAPVQMTFLGYPLTSAMPEVDYAIVDSVVYPPSVDVAFTEKFVSAFCMTASLFLQGFVAAGGDDCSMCFVMVLFC